MAIAPKIFTGIYHNLSAICPLTLRKVRLKQQNLFFVTCRQMAVYRSLR